jgi:hypothetical protein
MILSDRFPAYTEYNPKVPVWCITPKEGRVIHRFFDTSPFSPSGRYMALFRMPIEDRNPNPGEAGQIILVDLITGEEKVLAETCGWETQVGANVQWGTDDSQLYYNNCDTSNWKAFGVKLNPFTGEAVKLEGGVFMVSPDGRYSATTCPVRARCTQQGYGVIVPDTHLPLNTEIPEDDGLYITDNETGKCRLLISIKDIIEKAVPAFNIEKYKNGEFYGFQCKWNPQGTRLLFVLRWITKDRTYRKNHVITMKNDGTDIHIAISAPQWAKGGHHINWCPDGDYLSMNLNGDGDGLRFIKVKYDGTDLHKILDNVPGSGHPSIHKSGKYILTDAYNEDSVAYKDGTVPIRLVNLKTGIDEAVIRIKTGNPFDFSLRVDPHPAWDRSFRWIAFNGYVDGTRRVYIADLSKFVD